MEIQVTFNRYRCVDCLYDDNAEDSDTCKDCVIKKDNPKPTNFVAWDSVDQNK